MTLQKTKITGTDIGLISPRGMIYSTLFLLGLWGCLAIYNATVYSKHPVYFAGRQFIWLSSGMILLYCSAKIPFKYYKKFALPLAVLFYLPLLLVPLLGVKINGMKGWYTFGSVFFQPSELAKVPYMLLLAYLVVKLKSRNSQGKLFLVLMGAATVWTLPVLLQPDCGTALIYFIGFIIIFWISGGSIFYLVGLALACLPAIAFVVHQKGYINERILGFFNPRIYSSTTGWHVMQFEYTLARGGLWGTEWGKSLWSNAYLPLSYSDSSFASLTEAVGFAGAFPVIIGLMALVYIAYRLAVKQEDECRRLFILGMGTLIVIQAFIHISVNLVMIPPTGITLPMISYGGSSMFATLLGFGLILSASKAEQEGAICQRN